MDILQISAKFSGYWLFQKLPETAVTGALETTISVGALAIDAAWWVGALVIIGAWGTITRVTGVAWALVATVNIVAWGIGVAWWVVALVNITTTVGADQNVTSTAAAWVGTGFVDALSLAKVGVIAGTLIDILAGLSVTAKSNF